MTENHPITPPPELVQQWLNEKAEQGRAAEHIATQAARWGADIQLNMYGEWLDDHASDLLLDMFHSAMRPKPPSLAEQALFAIDEEQADLTLVNYKVIRAALERLKELEQFSDDQG